MDSASKKRKGVELALFWGLLIAAGLLAVGVEAQDNSAFDALGTFYVHNFGPEDYDAGLQNLGIAAGPDGLIYTANVDGVLQYDGVSWRRIQISNRSGARSVAVDAAGQIFVGAVGDLGYLAPDALGGMRYVSLVDRIAPEARQFAEVWRIEPTSAGVYFRTYELLFRWDGREMKVWPSENRYGQIFALNDVLYARLTDLGLMRMDGDSLVPVPYGGAFRDERIYGLVSWDEGTHLVVTRSEGMFLCRESPLEEAGCEPFASDLTERLVALQPYHATRLPDGRVAIATLRGGVVLIDGEGRLVRLLNEAAGLRSEIVLYTTLDRQGGLWLGLNDGLARVETGAPLSHWGESSGLVDQVVDVAWHRGQLYAATALGIYRSSPGSEGEAARFLLSPEVSAQSFSLLSTPRGLLVGSGGGLFNLDRQRPVTDIDLGTVLVVTSSRHDPEVLYLALSSGLARMRLRDGEWTDFERLEGAQFQVSSIVEDNRGRLWLGTETEGVLGVEPWREATGDGAASGGNDGDDGILRFREAEGLPAGASLTRRIGSEVLAFFPRAGLWRLNDADVFEPDEAFEAFLPRGSKSIQNLTEDTEGRVWIAAAEASGVAHPEPGGGYRWQPIALRRSSFRSVNVMRVDTEGSLWVGGSHGLLRYDTSHELEPVSYPVWIRRVSTGLGTILYDGQEDVVAEWPHRDNDLRFAFAAPRYDAPERTVYRFRLDGLDEDWSPWIQETDKDYTNLWEGRYVFRVQARDIYGFVSQEDTFAFRILPPWYRSGWAYSVYILALVAVVAAYRRSHRQQLRREREAAQRERTISRRLREVDKLKDEFLANTSHELRTPLNGITGLAESLLGGVTGELGGETRHNLEMIVHSGRRLSRLVDDILDFSKLRHGSLQLDLRAVDLRPLVDVVLTLSRPLVGNKPLDLVNNVPADLPVASADENRLQQILHNLVGNAVKFTDVGSIEVSAAVEEGRVTVRVADTGIGISAKKQGRIFDAFEQADASIEREFGGTGLGLAVTRQLVELHGGEIRVESSPGEGSVFSFTLPVVGEAAGSGDPVASGRRIASTAIAAEQEIVSPQPSAQPRVGAARLLAVDDDPINLQVLHNFLATEDIDLTLASSGEEALRLLEEQTFDMVLLDVMMPRLSGYEVCRVLREKYPLAELPVLFLTARSRDSDVVSGMALGGNDYLTKPISKERLLARVRSHLELLRAHRHMEDLVEEKVSQIKVLRGLLPICSGCKKIRDDEGYWSEVEFFIDRHSEASFSHGICPDCIARYHDQFPELRPDGSG